ncbi:glucosaminyl-phosphatidylinositol-acyltransferase PIGW-like [Anticarsia gemmatalis]|uniref:glucosaminyl-phosphatidylinositol- acyltransferase PIGW-like n=1 Tax=Anticarsia gemmatalis TaxID=129554 RepID=UPI003F76FBEB
MNAMEYKKYHESFMQNNHGTNAVHTFFCILFTVQSSMYISIRPTYSASKQFIYEYIVMVLPMILAHTVLAEYIYILNFIMFVFLSYKVLPQYKNCLKKFQTKNVFKNDRIPLISSLRGLTYLITVLCILAVDFRDFPRYLAKTERFGYSLMDTGVGLFVTMSGLVHKDIRKSTLKDVIKGNIKIVGILLLLGVGRFVSVKQLDYQEHVTEYGVHWNFFFTIAVCKILSTILLYMSDRALLLSIITLCIHEFVLYTGLQEWVFGDSPRDSLISANREGLSSSLGYVSIYLFAVHIRQLLLNKGVTKYDTMKKLALGTIILWLLLYFDHIRPTSRTLANASYCMYMNTLLVTMTTLMYFVAVLCDKKDNIQIPLILSTINTNGLSYFLIANLSTGAINLSMRTLLVPSSVTFVILNVYMIFTLAIVVYLKNMGFRI